MDVAAILTFPGYWVAEKKLGPVRVVYTKGLSEVIRSSGNNVLNEKEIDLFAFNSMRGIVT